MKPHVTNLANSIVLIVMGRIGFMMLTGLIALVSFIDARKTKN